MELIVAVDMNWGIGYDNDLLIHIPNDLKNFKELTTNNIIIYGRKTLDSFKNGEPLPNRTNVIVSRNNELKIDNAIIFHDINEVLTFAKEKENNGEKVFIIGGEQIYKQFEPYCSGAYVTKILDTFIANKHMPNLDKMENWKIEKQLMQEVYEQKKSSRKHEYSIIHYKNLCPRQY